MKTIPLTQGLFAQVDDADYEWLMQWKWSAAENISGITYAQRWESGRIRLMHRQILGLERGDRRQGDHINGEGLNNQRKNLRAVTPSQNLLNSKRHREGKISGVCFRRARNKWQTVVGSKYIGLFETKEEAHQAYVEAVARLA